LAGTPLASFLDFFRTTGPLIFTGPEKVINEAQNRTYILSRMMGGDSMLDMVQGGETIRDDIYFDVVSSYLHYQPNEEFSYDNPQVITQWSVPWRFTKVDLVFTDQEIGLNAGELSRGAMFHQFKRLRRVKEQNFYTDLCNGMEQDLFRTPNNANMEVAGGTDPYSLFCFFTEVGATLTDAKATGTLPTGFLTIQGISPTTETRWQNPVEQYTDDPVIQTSTIGVWDCFSAMSKMYYRLRFEQLPKRAEMGEGSNPASNNAFIFTSLQGIVNWEHGVRAAQDTFRGGVNPSDPHYATLNYRGIPMLYVEEMDFAEVWVDGVLDNAAEYNDSVSRTGAALADPTFEGPRYVWIVPEYCRKVVKRDRYMHMEGPFSPSAQPFTRIIVSDTWHNNICRSRQRGGGIVSPGANIDRATGAPIA
jgi:hypothetical protein